MTDITFGMKENEKEYLEREGAYLIAVKNEKLAVVRTERGCFLIGGGLEENESHISCIKREALEETGYQVNVEGFIGSADTYCEHWTFGAFHPIQNYYYGQIEEKIKEAIEKDQHFEWIRLDDIEKEMFSEQQKWAVEKYVSDFYLF